MEDLTDLAKGVGNVAPAILTPGAYAAFAGAANTPIGQQFLGKAIPVADSALSTFVPGWKQFNDAILSQLPEEKKAETKSFLTMVAVGTIL